MIPEAPEGEAPPTVPPCLRRRGPARIDLTLRGGLCPEMGRGRVHVRAGRAIAVRVVPPTPRAKVEITSEPPLLGVVPVHRVEAGAVPTYYAEFIGHTSLRVSPWPTTARLRVIVVDGLPEPCRLTIPVTIWPSVSTLVLWWLVVYGGIVGLRWQNTLARSESVWDIFPKLGDDLPYLLQLLLLGVIVLVPLRAVAWFMTIPGLGDDDG